MMHIPALILGVILAGPFPPLTESGQPNIQSAGAVVVDLDSGEVLYQRKADEARAIASISKVMAALVLLDKGLDLDGATRMEKADWAAAKGGPWGRLKPGWRIRHRDLLEAGLGASDNVAIIALGRAVGLTPRAFGKAMTAKAKAMGLTHARFKEPTGLSYGNKATPREVVAILAAALQRPEISDIMRSARFSVQPVGKRALLEYRHTVRPLWSGKWAILGGKTGYNKAAKYSVVMASRLKDGRRLGMAFLGAKGKLTRFGDFGRVMHWLKEAPDAEGTHTVEEAGAAVAEASPKAAAPAAAPTASDVAPKAAVQDEDAPPGWQGP